MGSSDAGKELDIRGWPKITPLDGFQRGDVRFVVGDVVYIKLEGRRMEDHVEFMLKLRQPITKTSNLGLSSCSAKERRLHVAQSVSINQDLSETRMFENKQN